MLNQKVLSYWFENFQPLDKRQTGLSVNLYLDDSTIYKNLGEKYPFILVINGYEDYIYDNSILALSLKDCETILNDEEIKLFQKDFNKIKLFVKQYRNKFIALANQKLEIFDFYHIIEINSIYDSSSFLHE